LGLGTWDFMVKKRWKITKPDVAKVKELSQILNVSPVVAHLLITRGFTDAESAQKFLKPSKNQLNNPSLLLCMNVAVRRILRAIENGEKILIYGDYDVDGTTGTVVMRKALQLLGAKTGYHIPHRFTEGYGIQQPALEKAKENNFSLVISVDCGIRAREPLFWAKDNGLDVIVTDHHLPDEEEGSPPAYCVLNPNQTGCKYPDKNLAGVGVAFKLVHALLREKGKENLVDGFLKMVAIGTVADVAQLTGENRAIVSLGLNDLPKATNLGLRALMEVAGFNEQSEMTAFDLGFRIGPRINAAGRMDAARDVVRLFETKDKAEAMRLAKHLDDKNRERQIVQGEIIRLAIAEWETNSKTNQTHAAVIAGDDWHRGVIGIAASKIAEKLHRPCVVISFDADEGHGSGRSIESYHLLDGLTSCADLFEKFGGHSHAAGLAIKRKNVEEFRKRLNEHAAAHLSDEDLIPQIDIDAELKAESLSLDLVNELKVLEPFGAGNSKPVFMTRPFRLVFEPRTMKERHLKLMVAGADNKRHDVVWWDGVEKLDGQTLKAGDDIELAYTLDANTWNGSTRLQLVAQDLKRY